MAYSDGLDSSVYCISSTDRSVSKSRRCLVQFVPRLLSSVQESRPGPLDILNFCGSCGSLIKNMEQPQINFPLIRLEWFSWWVLLSFIYDLARLRRFLISSLISDNFHLFSLIYRNLNSHNSSFVQTYRSAGKFKLWRLNRIRFCVRTIYGQFSSEFLSRFRPWTTRTIYDDQIHTTNKSEHSAWDFRHRVLHVRIQWIQLFRPSFCLVKLAGLPASDRPQR